MSDTINPAIHKFKSVPQSQNDLLLAQSTALKALLESKPSSTHDHITSPQPLHPPVTMDITPPPPTPLSSLAVQSLPSTQLLPSTSEIIIPPQPNANPISFSPSVEARLRNINDYIQANIQPAPQSEPETPVTQAELDALTAVFKSGKDKVNKALLKQQCDKLSVGFPAKLANSISADQVKNLIYKVAVAIQKKPNSNLDQRYLYVPVFWFKTESICTCYLNSFKMCLKPHPFIHRSSLQSKVRDFERICSGLKTNPENIGKIIKDISVSFYLREKRIHVAKYNLRYNLSDAIYFAKVLCVC